jgi:lipoprotein-anchoring transpeptidase ErfK/SrfK
VDKHLSRVRVGISRRSLRLALGLAAVAVIGVGSAAQAQGRIFWPEAYPDAYIAYPYPDDIDAPPPPAARRQPHRKPHHLAKPEAAKTVRKPKGPLIIAISIDRQTMKVYDANGFFAETPVSTGMRGHSTPLGVFSVIQKQKWHRSNIYSGAPMPYMQRITWSGIAMHAGVLPGYPASHGCIRMPMNFAVKLWGWTRTGARVIITPGEVIPAEFSHPMLVTHRPEPVEVTAAPASTVGEVRMADASGTIPQASAPGISASPAAGTTTSAEHHQNSDAKTSDAMASASVSELRSAIGPDSTSSKPAPEPIAVSTAPEGEIKSSETKSSATKSEEVSPAEGHADTDTSGPANEGATAETSPATDTPAIQPDKTNTAGGNEPPKAATTTPGANMSAATKDQSQPPSASAVKAEVFPTPKRAARIAIFVSRKDSRIYVRQNFAPLFDAPITITASDRPLGTHVFTAEADKDNKDNFHWSVVSLPALTHRATRVIKENHAHRRTASVHAAPRPVPVPDGAADALNRISIPEDVMTKIAESLTSGDSIVVSDQGIAGGETGEGTDFIVTLR